MQSLSKKTMFVLIALVSLLAFSNCTKIEPGNVGITVDLTGDDRGVNEYTLETGRVFYNPITQQIIEYSVHAERSVWTASKDEGSESNEEIVFTDKDGLAIACDIAYVYKLSPDKVPAFYVHYRTPDLKTWSDAIGRDIVRGQFNNIGGTMSVEEILEQKDNLIKAVRDSVNAYFNRMVIVDNNGDTTVGCGMEFEMINYVGKIRPPQQIIDRINDKIQASQLAIQKENEIRQKEADAKKKVAEARGLAESKIEIARGDSAAVVLRAQAEAERNNLLSRSINDRLIQWRELQNQENAIAEWGKGGANVPYFMSGEGTGGTIFQLTQPDGKK